MSDDDQAIMDDVDLDTLALIGQKVFDLNGDQDNDDQEVPHGDD